MILLYGAYGYTGKIICEEAQRAGVKLILAGRSAEKLEALPYSWEKRTFELNDPDVLDAQLKDVKVVLHAAGPFIYTAKPMMEACLRNQVHYTDITGEITVFERAARMGAAAKKAGIVMLPGTGFDVVPTDCLAAYLHQQLPDATHIKLAFSALGGGLSRGTALTAAQSLGEAGAVRKDGKIIRQPVGHKTLTAPFHGKPRFCMTIPWGDVSTAYHSTGIPNVETYMGIRPKSYRYVKLQRYFSWLLKMSWVRNIAHNRIKKGPAGPDAAQRAKGQSLVWGEVTNSKGEKKAARIKTASGYSLTAITAVKIALAVMEGKVKPGFQTPSKAFGADFIFEVEGTEREDL